MLTTKSLLGHTYVSSAWSTLFMAEMERFVFARCVSQCSHRGKTRGGRIIRRMLRLSALRISCDQMHQKTTRMGGFLMAEMERFACRRAGRGTALARHRRTIHHGAFRISCNYRPIEKPRSDEWGLSIGGDGEIRTLELFVAVTRFPIVRPRPD